MNGSVLEKILKNELLKKKSLAVTVVFIVIVRLGLH